MIQPSVSEQSDNNSITETKLPGWNLTSLNELKDHGFDHDSKKVFLIRIPCLATNNNRSVNGSTHGVHKNTKTANKHAKSQQHMN